jgi:hypothetical protein
MMFVMARVSRALRLLRNAEAALLSAIEIYNKPTFAYREETFAILAINAWELLLKAKVLHEHNNSASSLRVYYFKKKASGQPSKKPSIKTNRAGNEMTIGIHDCIVRLEKKNIKVAEAVKLNLHALIEIRDNAIHYINAGPQLAKLVLEVGTASVQNFIELAKRWFKLDLSDYGLYLMPIGFVAGSKAKAVFLSSTEQKVLDYIANLVSKNHDATAPSDFSVALDVKISMDRGGDPTAAKMTISTGAGGIPVTLSDAEFHKIYKWDYENLTDKLKVRYSDFKSNGKFHSNRKKIIAALPQLHTRRFLDPIAKAGGYKDWYHPDIIAEFDKVYTRKPD